MKTGSILLSDRHPDLIRSYREHFIDGFEHRYYHQRIGHVRALEAVGVEAYSGVWRRAKAWGRDIPFPSRSRDQCRFIEKHLGRENWNRHVAATGRGKPLHDHYFLGLYAGTATRHVVLDLDCHGGRRLCYRKDGLRLPVADLSLAYLREVRRLYDLERRPDVLVTSSRSLGLYAYFKFRHPFDTAAALGIYRAMTGGVLDCEIYPNFRNCLRRPFGNGSYTLSRRGVLRDFADQMSHYLDPEPLPPFDDVVAMLLRLWAEQHEDMAACIGAGHRDGRWDAAIDVGAESTYRDDRIALIRRWLAQGCPECCPKDDAPSRSHTRTGTVATGVRTLPTRADAQIWPDAWKEPAMPWRDRIWYLARHGLPLPDTLNCALLDLAQWLLGVELFDDGDRDGRAHRLLGLFCATRHNGLADRLEGVGEVADIPTDVCRQIDYALLGARDVLDKDAFRRMRSRRYRAPLRVAHLLAGEGEPNGYAPTGIVSSRQQTTHPLSPYSVAAPAAAPGPVAGMDDLEAMLESGILDHPLPASIEGRITTRGKVLVFLRRLGNYLSLRGGVARVHGAKLALLAGVEPADRKAVGRYKKAGIQARLFTETGGYVVGERSKEYSLTPEAQSLLAGSGGA